MRDFLRASLGALAITSFVALFILGTCLIDSAAVRAETKIEGAIAAQLKSSKFVRVMIVTRPDPDLPAGGQSLASPAAYLAGALSGSLNIKQVGSLPVTTAEVTSEALNRLREDPNVVLVTRDIPSPPTFWIAYL